MNLFEIFGVWIITAFLGITLAAPLGPINLELLKNALNPEFTRKAAWISALLIGIGAMTGDFIVALSAVTLGGEIMESVFSNSWIKLLLFTLNLIILSFLGLSTLAKRPIGVVSGIDGELPPVERLKEISIHSAVKKYVTGLSIVITSPWSYLWWASFGTIILFSDLSLPDPISRLIIVLMFLSGIFLWLFAFSTTLTIIGKHPNPKFFSRITKGTALVLLLFALIILRDLLLTLGEILK